uniref:Histidine kinase n=1 Tax=Prevotella sp. GTC17262 TaxID=3236797 RepID=A0AB33JDI0_9BACT
MRRISLFTLFLAVAWLLTLIGCIMLYFDVRADRDRVHHNQGILLHNGSVRISETSAGRSHASAPALTLRPSEFNESGDALVNTARQVGIKTKRISHAATTTTRTTADIVAPVRLVPSRLQADSLPSEASASRPVRPDSLCFSWHDPWLSLSGCLSDSLFRGTVSSTDTLDIVVHRVPKRFLFFRFGCREVRMDIISRNPHTRLTYARYYKLVK